MLSSTLPIPLLSPPSSISDLHHPRFPRDQDYGIAKMATRWKRTRDYELWPPEMEKDYGLWIVATWWTKTMDYELWPPDEQGPHCFPSPRPHHRPTGCTDEPIATRDQQIQNSQPGDLKVCLFTASILPLPHLVSSSGSCGGGVFGFKSRRGFFFSFRIDWSTVPEASAANIIEDLGNFAFEFLTLETRTIDCSYEMICKRITSVSVLDLYDSP